MFKNYYLNKGIQPRAYKLAKITQEFVFKEMSSINPQKVTGMDNISPKFLKKKQRITYITPLWLISSLYYLRICTKWPEDSKRHTAL